MNLKRKINIQRNLRMGIIVIILFVIIASSYSASQESTIEEKTTLYTYVQTGNYDYYVFVEDNSLFNSHVITGQKIHFRKIIESINSSYTYQFDIDKSANVHGNYKLKAKIQTTLWEKDVVLKSTTSFSGKKFTIDFHIDIDYFEDIIRNINEDIGISSQDVQIIITCDVYVTEETEDISEKFSSSLIISLGEGIIEIGNDNLLTSKTENIEETKKVKQSNQMLWSIPSLSVIALIWFALFTKNENQLQISTQIKKIMKKYDEWIIESEKIPSTEGLIEIYVKNFENLIKASEDLEKPIICYIPESNVYEFYVFDGMMYYKFILSNNEKKN